jgi:hypothetical protein
MHRYRRRRGGANRLPPGEVVFVRALQHPVDRHGGQTPSGIISVGIPAPRLSVSTLLATLWRTAIVSYEGSRQMIWIHLYQDLRQLYYET